MIRYEYDGLSRQIQQRSTDQFFSALWQVIEQRNSGDAVVTSQVFSIVYVDAMVARDRNTSGDDSVLEERLYPLQDANFNVTAIVNTSGTVEERFVNDAYGGRIVVAANWTTTTETKAWSQGHQGGFYDPVLTEKMLFRWRVYDTETMRWTTNDPAGYVDGINKYNYVRSGPLNSIDPMGLEGSGNVAIDFFEASRELAVLIAAANAWNTTSPGWGFSNQCAEQANNLRAALIPLNPRYWSIKTDGGANRSGFFAYHHHVLVLMPKNGNFFPPIVIDPFKGRSGKYALPVIVETGSQFRKRFPYDCGDKGCRDHVLPVNPGPPIPEPIPIGPDGGFSS